jgi:kojibiose phosphorylase
MNQSVSQLLENPRVPTSPAFPQPKNPLYTDWVLIERGFDPNQLHARETVFTIGNGYLGTRGSFEEGYPRSMPATLINGVYDAVPVLYTELVNCSDWLLLTISLHDESSPRRIERFRLDQGEVLSYQRWLDLRYGLLRRYVRWRSPSGKTIDLQFERFASLADPHVLAVRCLITPIDWDGAIAVHASINGYAENQGFNHWELITQEQTETDGSEDFQLKPTIALSARTRQSQIELGMAATVMLQGTEATFELESAPGYPTLAASYSAVMGQTVLVEKMVTIYTSREVERPLETARSKLTTLPPYPACWQQHKQAWEAAWDASDVMIEGDIQAQLAVRYSVFQLLIAAPRWDQRVSIPAKTLSGFAYRGHIFWDTEIFMLPLFTFTQPDLARHLLSYRYHTLEGARRKARSYGYQGAMFAWESAGTGDDVTPRWSLPSDPYGSDIRIWCRDREIHISADIAYAIWQYWQATGDDDWMRDYGAEMILDAAVFWTSRVEWNSQLERYEIREVLGADEYHEHVNNNAFTNRMVQWHLEKAIAVHTWLQNTFPAQATTLEQKLALTPELRQSWEKIATHLWMPYHPETGFIEQFEGFCNLEDIDLQAYEPRTQSMQTILGIDGANRRQVLKQPDVLMLLYLMRQWQEFPYSPDRLKTNWDYYAPRTDITYGSSLGPAIHASLAADLGDSKTAYQHFMQAALVDLENTRGNAAEGIHGACAGGVWQAIVFGFAGIYFQDCQPVATPHLPSHWTRLAFRLHWRGTWYPFDFTMSAANSSKPEPQSLEMHTATSLPSQLTLRGAIFDLDGVLTDTAEYHYRAWQRLADEAGLPFDRQANEALRGISRRESLLKIVGTRPYTEDQLEEMMARKNRYYQEFLQSVTPDDLLPGALSLLKELRQLGIRTALASASKNARTVIEKLGIAEWIDAIADGYSVERPKPAPDLFLYAANQLRLPPAECVVFEDATAGIEAALAAGMWAVGDGPVERVGNAHVVFPDLDGIRWADIVSSLEAVSARLPKGN